MDLGTISSRYAKALLAYANRHGAVDRVAKDARRLVGCYAKYPALRRVLDNRLLTPQKKEEVIARCCGRMSGEFANFVRLVTLHYREEFLREMCLDYIQLVRVQENLLDVWVTVAAEPDAETLALFERRLARMTGKKVTVRASVDRTIIGGYILRWDTYRLDRSVAGQLKKIETNLRHGR